MWCCHKMKTMKMRLYYQQSDKPTEQGQKTHYPFSLLRKIKEKLCVAFPYSKK